MRLAVAGTDELAGRAGLEAVHLTLHYAQAAEKVVLLITLHKLEHISIFIYL